jgi:hypothetical protein
MYNAYKNYLLGHLENLNKFPKTELADLSFNKTGNKIRNVSFPS